MVLENKPFLHDVAGHLFTGRVMEKRVQIAASPDKITEEEDIPGDLIFAVVHVPLLPVSGKIKHSSGKCNGGKGEKLDARCSKITMNYEWQAHGKLWRTKSFPDMQMNLLRKQ